MVTNLLYVVKESSVHTVRNLSIHKGNHPGKFAPPNL